MTPANRRPIRLAAIGLTHEANTFATGSVGIDEFRRAGILRGEALTRRHADTGTIMGGYLRFDRGADIEIVPLWYTEITPNAQIAATAFETLTEEMLATLHESGPWDGILLALHGAAVADGTPDADGHILTQVRNTVGPQIPIGVTLDLHANVSHTMASASDIIVGYRTNPHVDASNRAMETAELIARAARGEINISQSLIRIPAVINILRQGTSDEPMLSLMEYLEKMVAAPGVLSASLFEGYPYADVSDMGMSVLVAIDGDVALANRLAGDLARRVWDARSEFVGSSKSAEQALDDSFSDGGTTLLLDVGDNIGGGADGTSTEILEVALRKGLNPILTILCDPNAVEKCVEAGEGSVVELYAGTPQIRLEGTVSKINSGTFTDSGPTHGGTSFFDAGRTAVLELDHGSVVVLTTRAIMPSSVQQLTALGLSPRDFTAVTAKGVHSPLASYKPVVDRVTTIDTDGVTAASLDRLPYRHRRTPLFPFEKDFIPNFQETES